MDGHEAFAGFGGGCVEECKVFATMDGGCEIVLNEIIFFARPETTENQDGFAHTSFAQFHTFTGGSDAEPVRAELFEGFGNLRATVAVAVSFDNA